MASTIRKIIKHFFVSLTILLCLIFLISCLSPFVSPNDWSIIGFLPLAVPYIIIVLFFCLLFWLIVKPSLALLPLICLLIGYKQVTAIFAWHFSNNFAAEKKAPSAIRMVTWNVRGMYGISNSPYTQSRNRTEIASLIKNLDPDIFCLQEFTDKMKNRKTELNNLKLFTEKWPYHFYHNDFSEISGKPGMAIFSKFPIIGKGYTKFPGLNSESLVFADIIKEKDTIRVYTTHLQSFEFNEKDYHNIEKIKDPNSKSLEASKSLFTKMRKAFQTRAAQADIVRKIIDSTPYPYVICGDFNDVPNSYTYFHVRNQNQDAFLATSFGIGRTFNNLAPTLRIDYILPDNNFNIEQFDVVDEGLSDHHLLVTDFILQK